MSLIDSIILMANRHNSISSFLTYITFVYFDSLLYLRISVAYKSGSIFFIFKFKGSTLHFPINIMLSIVISYIIFIVLRYTSFIHNLFGILPWKVFQVGQAGFLHLFQWSYDFCAGVYLNDYSIDHIDLQIVNHPCIIERSQLDNYGCSL